MDDLHFAGFGRGLPCLHVPRYYPLLLELGTLVEIVPAERGAVPDVQRHYATALAPDFKPLSLISAL